MKATFKLKKLIHGESLLPNQAMSLFRKLILPIGMYGAEVWGTLPKIKHMSKQFEKLPFENTFMSFSKYILGVRKQTTNAAVRGDLGIYPLFIDIIITMIKYYKRIQQQSHDSILWYTFCECKKLAELGNPSWYHNLNEMCIEFSKEGVHNLQWKHPRTIREMLKVYYVDHWKKSVNPNITTGKLQLYGKLKSTIKKEDYLEDITIIQHRQALSKLRLSAHSLRIETGRFSKNRIDINQRICLYCNRDEIDDEKHFVLECPSLDIERNNMLHSITLDCPNYNNLSADQRLFYLLNASGNIIKTVGKFCYYGFEKRSQLDLIT